MNFFVIFLKFSITSRIGTHRNDFFFFFFLSFSTFPNLFLHGNRLWWCFLIIWIFLLFFWNFLFRVGMKPIGTIIFIFSLSRPFPTNFGLKWSYDGVLKFFEFFYNFFGIFKSRSVWNPSKRLFSFSLFLGVSHPIFAWKEAMMVFSNFLNFFVIFLEFSIASRIGTHQNDFFFIFCHSPPFPTYFGMERGYDGVF